MKGIIIMRLEIDNGDIVNYSTLEMFISSATLENANELKSLLSDIKLKLSDNSVNHLRLALLAEQILNKCNELGIGVDVSSIESNNKQEKGKRIALTNLPSSVVQDRAGKASVTLIIAGILTTAIMYVILSLGWLLNR